jgi:hypothetical protein
LPARHGRASADVNPTTSPMAKLLAVTDAPQFSNVEDQIGLPSCPARGEGLTERSLECSRCFCRFASGWRPWPWSQFWSHSCGSAEVHGRTSDALTPTNTAGRCFAELESGRPARVRGFNPSASEDQRGCDRPSWDGHTPSVQQRPRLAWTGAAGRLAL